MRFLAGDLGATDLRSADLCAPVFRVSTLAFDFATAFLMGAFFCSGSVADKILRGKPLPPDKVGRGVGAGVGATSISTTGMMPSVLLGSGVALTSGCGVGGLGSTRAGISGSGVALTTGAGVADQKSVV